MQRFDICDFGCTWAQCMGYPFPIVVSLPFLFPAAKLSNG